MTKLPRRALELCVAFFALYAFVFVPLGERTGLQHLQAILGTKEAERAASEIKIAGSRMLRELLEFQSGAYKGDPVVPDLGE